MDKRQVHKYSKRAGFNTDHHLRPSSRGGDSREPNIIQLDAYRHSAWHLLFSNLTIDEVIMLLKRLKQIKESQRIYYLTLFNE